MKLGNVFASIACAVALVATLPGATVARAAIKLPAQVGNHMVLQQQAKARLWGWATPGARIAVSVSWSKEKYTATTATDGRWQLTVATPQASYTPQTVSLSGDGSKLTLTDVLIGEVWLCSGQSNMEMPLNGFTNQPVEGSNEAIARAGRYSRAIHFVTIPKTRAAAPQDSVAGAWQTCIPATVRWFSAVAYFFGRELHEILDVPVGLINCSWGGSHLEGWMPDSLLIRYKEAGAQQTSDPIKYDYDTPVIMYNGMLHPIAGYTVRGVLWNQGESNVGRHKAYPVLFKAMVDHWSRLWGQPLHFYTVEIPPYSYGNVEGIDAALLREAQHEAARITPHSAIVCTNDLMYDWQVEDIHGSRKLEIGQRLAYAAASQEYGVEGIAWRSPEFDSVSYEGQKAVITLKYADGGLTPHDGMRGFEVAGSDGVFHPATASCSFSDLKVTVTASAGVDSIKAVRYNFKNFSIGHVHGLSGLPLVPFRTDK